MAPKNGKSIMKYANKGAWTVEEDRKLAKFIEIHGAKKWKSVPVQAGLNRCGKSCRFRWLNYLRPNIKRGNISDQEEDLILRLHKLLGNRWSLIAGRLPGRTDNEIKNYWNSHLSKKKNQEPSIEISTIQESESYKAGDVEEIKMTKESSSRKSEDLGTGFNVDDFFDFSEDGSLSLEWVGNFLELDENLMGFEEINGSVS